MNNIKLRAHFDGSQIVLDDAFPLQPNTELLITVLARPEDDERATWTRFSQEGLARTYGDSEPEYSLDLIKVPNQDYEGR
jgi:hypothetical protein